MNYLMAAEMIEQAYNKPAKKVAKDMFKVFAKHGEHLDHFTDLTCKETDTEGYLFITRNLYKTKPTSLIFLWPGTESYEDLRTDLKFFRLPYKVNGKSVGWMCRGFRKVIYSVRPNIQKAYRHYLTYNDGELPIYCIGHSLGAVLARGCADALYEIHPSGDRKVITMGEPGGLTRKSAKLYIERNPQLIRIMNHGDPIIKLPPFSWFPEPKKTILLNKGRQGHGITRYIEGLKRGGHTGNLRMVK